MEGLIIPLNHVLIVATLLLITGLAGIMYFYLDVVRGDA